MCQTITSILQISSGYLLTIILYDSCGIVVVQAVALDFH